MCSAVLPETAHLLAVVQAALLENGQKTVPLHASHGGGGGGGGSGGGSGGAPAAEISGVSFWAWAGEGRPRTPGGFWQPGDALLGDPPHEHQGWYSVYDDDRQMSELITRTAARIHANASAFYT